MKVTLDGYPLPIDAGAAWTLKEGTAPHIAEFVFETSVANALFKDSKVDGSSLVFDPRGGTNMRLGNVQGMNTISKLTILGTGPADNPGERTVTVADRRWRLKRKHIYRAYNLRRKTGRRRRVAGQSQTVATSTINDDVAYAIWSIKSDGKAWTSSEIVTDLMNRIFGKGKWKTSRGADGKELLTGIPPIEGLEIDLPADAALGVMLQQIGGSIGLTVNHQGKIFLYPRFDNSERKMLGIRSAGATIDPSERRAIVGGPLAAAQDRSVERPSAVRVLFTRVVEMRLDAVEPSGRVSVPEPDPLPPRMSNVIPSPEDFTYLSTSYVVGQWLPIVTYFNYLETVSDNTLNRQNPISYRTVNRAWLSGYLDSYGHPKFDNSGVWANRINAIKTHYRLTYQVDRPWRDRIRELDPYRVSIQDYETGSRAPATVFADHAVFTSWRALGRGANDPPRDWETILNRYANPNSNGSQGGEIIGTDQSAMKSAPAFASIIDQDQGIIRIAYDTGNDVTGQLTRIVRSAITRESMPSDNPSARNQYLQKGRLENEHNISVILTAKLGAPAGNRRFHIVEISSDEGQAAAKLPGFKQGKAKGPVIEVRVPPTLEPARFAWDDLRSAEFAAAFEIDPGNPDEDITEAFGEPINQDQVREVALATAARVYHRFVDRAEGGITTPMITLGEFGGLFGSGVRGVVDRVEIRADPSRGFVTTITVPDEAPDLAFEALLPPQYRKMIGRMVDLGD